MRSVCVAGQAVVATLFRSRPGTVRLVAVILRKREDSCAGRDRILLPNVLPLTIDSLSSDGIYLIDNGVEFYMWVATPIMIFQGSKVRFGCINPTTHDITLQTLSNNNYRQHCKHQRGYKAKLLGESGE